jgi:glycosylphosphatidylinositol transamidase (GPIT) subunit GPI8
MIDTSKKEIIIYNFDCNRGKSNVEMDKLYYKFFNEWGGKSQITISDVTFNIYRDAYDGIVVLCREEK